MPKQIDLDGELHEFPDDFTDEDIAAALGGSAPAAPKSPLVQGADNAVDRMFSAPQAPTKPQYSTNPDLMGRVKENAVAELKRLPGQAWEGIKQLPGAVGETILSGVTGTAAAASNLVNAATGAKELFKAPGESDADYYARARKDTTYAPRTQGGKNAADFMGATVGKVVEGGGQGVEQLTGSPAARELFTDAVGVAGGGIVGKKAAKPVVNTAKDAADSATQASVDRSAAANARPAPPQTKITETPIESLRAAGFDLGTADVQAIKPGQKRSFKEGFNDVMEVTAGREPLRQSRLSKNQARATALVARGIGLPETTQTLTPKLFEQQRTPHLAKYEEVGKAVGKFAPTGGFGAALDAVTRKTGLSPEARRAIGRDVDQYRYAELSGADAVKTVSALRRRAAKEHRSEDVNIQDRGDAHLAIADAIESEIGAALEAAGNTALANEWKASRTALAKLHEAEIATKAGQVDPHILKRLRDRGAPLSGEAAIVADAAEFAPHVTQHSSTINNPINNAAMPTGTGVLDFLSAGARPGLRKLMSREGYQERLGPKANEIGPGAGLSDYFPVPEQVPEAPPPAPPAPPPNYGPMQRGPNLSLVDEQQVNPADVLDFEATGPNPRAAGMAGDLGLQELAPYKPKNPTDIASDLDVVPWDAEASPGGPFEFGRGVPYRDPGAAEPTVGFNQLSEGQRGSAYQGKSHFQLADDVVGGEQLPPQAPGPRNRNPNEGAPDPSIAEDIVFPSELSIADDIVVQPSTREGFYSISVNGKPLTEVEGRAAATDLVRDLVPQELSDQTSAAPVANGSRKPTARTNNASGESSASVEAINRVRDEKKAGRNRVAIDPDGNGTPLEGVDAVDAAAPKGRLIVQRGVGRNDYSILDRGGLSITQANGLLNRYLAQLQRDE